MTDGVAKVAISLRMDHPGSGARGGHTIVEGTRIGAHDVIGLLQNGETVESIVAGCFPNLTRAQVYECLAYYEDLDSATFARSGYAARA